MRRTLALALTMTSLLAVACDRSAPTSPSSAAVTSAAMAVAPSASPTLFGASAVDFARCLQIAALDCFTARRVALLASGASITAPGAPSGLSAIAVGGAVTLTWTAPSSGDAVTAYLIEAGSAPGLVNLANVTTGPATSFSATGVGAGTYYVRVRAQNAGGTSGASSCEHGDANGRRCPAGLRQRQHRWNVSPARQHWLIGAVRIFVHPEARTYDKSHESDALPWIVG